jgi:hypothetical protein
MSVVPLATEAWVTIATAVLTGLFGFASGAGLAAIVTTGHERRQRFRERMIQAADSVVELLVEAQLELSRATTRARTHTSDDQEAEVSSTEIQPRWELVDKHLRVAAAAEDRMLMLLGHLYVTFRGPEVGDKAVAIHTRLVDWHRVLFKARRANDFGRFDAEVRQARNNVSTARDEFLQELNKQIRRIRL